MVVFKTSEIIYETFLFVEFLTEKGPCLFCASTLERLEVENLNILPMKIKKIFLSFHRTWGWSGGAKVLCILHHWGVQLILAYSWARPAILVVGKGRGGMFLFLLFLHFLSCSSFFPVPLFHLLYSLFYPREREKRDRRESRGDEREGQGRKRNRKESEETEEIKTFPLFFSQTTQNDPQGLTCR